MDLKTNKPSNLITADSVSGKRRRAQPRPRLQWWLVIVAVVSLLAFAVVWLVGRSNNAIPTASSETSNNQPQIERLEGRYLMNGTIFWGRGVEKWSRQADGSYDYEYPFSGLESFAPEKYDAWVADHECPVLDKVISFERQVNELVFNCRPEFLPAAVEFFQFINLANNHSGDQGEAGYLETRQRFVEAGAQVFGHYDPAVKSETCQVMRLPIRAILTDGRQREQHLPVAFCAWHYFGRLPRPGELEVIESYASIMPVFAFAHMGAEYSRQAQPTQRAIAQKIIDLGADFVVANNPHWVQNTEAHNGKLIVYSTGNFIFDQLDDEGLRSLSLDVTMKLDYQPEMADWLDLADQCGEAEDCWSLIELNPPPKLSPQYSFAVVAGDGRNRLTKRGDKQLQAWVERRANWSNTLKHLAGDEPRL